MAKSQPPGSRGGGGGRGGGREGAFSRVAGREGPSGRTGFAAGRGRGGRSGGRGSGADGRENTSARQWQGAAAGDRASRLRVPADAPHVEAATGAPRQRLLPAGGAAAMAFVPRSVSAAKPPGKAPPPAKSNADFRSMFLKKSSGAV